MQPAIQTILNRFGVDQQYGFLPAVAPLRALPEAYAAWDQLAADLSPAIKAGSVGRSIAELPLIHPSPQLTDAQLERAMLLLSCFAHAYVFSREPAADHLPAAVAVTLWIVADRLGRPPLISHASIVLNNWRLLDPALPFRPDNLATLQQFDGSSDESWFYLLTAYMEKAGARAVAAATATVVAAGQEATAELELQLEQLASGIHELEELLLQMRLHCDPYIFYLRVRPYLASFHDIRYEGVSETPQSFNGGSAAQSSLLQAFDAALGVKHPGKTGAFLEQMRDYMPPRHAAFIRWIEQHSKVRKIAGGYAAGREAYRACLHQLASFRQAHLGIVNDYIVAQMKEAGPGNQTGTGGTHLLHFLTACKENTERAFGNDR